MGVFRNLLKSSLPESARVWLRYRTNRGYRQMIKHLRARAEQARLVEEARLHLLAQTGCVVATGPFAGLRYIEKAVGSAWAPKVLGTYEMELAPVIETVIRTGYSRIIQIGAAEGYYAVGLASRMPNARVVAFEAQTASHSLLRELAAFNGVSERLEIRGPCSPDELTETLQCADQSLVVCDVEGAELELLDPMQCPLLRKTDLLVELHPWLQPEIDTTLRSRFELTHRITAIRTRIRTLQDLPPKVKLPSSSALACLDETRPCPMTWFWMTAFVPAQAR